MYQADTLGFANDFHLIHYGARAIGGVGGIILEATAVEARGRITEHDLGIYSDEHVSGLKRIVENIKKNGCIAGIQLAHAGRKSQTSLEIIAPSAIPYPDMKMPKEMTTDDIQTVILAFQSAAYRANEAGFDLIEIHAAHGYLINQFLSPLTNKRIDAYGGDIYHRLRFLSEIIDAIKTVWPEEKILGIRFSATEYHENGNNVDDIIEVINFLKPKGIDYINVSSGGVVPTHINAYNGYQLDFASKIRKETNIKVMGGGLITNAIDANNAIKEKGIDLIFIGRELLRNPHFPYYAAKELNVDFPIHKAYIRAK